MVGRKYDVNIYFSSEPNLDMDRLERELEEPYTYFGDIELGGPRGFCTLRYKTLEKSKALQIVDKFSGLEEVTSLTLRMLSKEQISTRGFDNK